ncbi:hypothetical protein FHT32_004976 [Variovorax sp. SG517]|uniref:hypothetical protein n=1 Tax=Variovorax sp. SG517 TaxID=2587117 RepID=UPI00159D99AC|nr:hypothetical protein [Variovorax sp. SG517]NVM91312.1 hypothetical protein [Variovorax sp. SG517]
MPDVSFSIWWVLAPLLAWLAFTLCVTLVRERRKHAAGLARTRRAADILANGTPAMALVISLSDTGQRRSGESATWAIAKLHLRVQATAGSEAFEVDQTAAIALPELPGHAAGKTLAVRFDPASHEVVLERSGDFPAHHGDDLTRLRPSTEAPGR